jgi:hypothetical protein
MSVSTEEKIENAYKTMLRDACRQAADEWLERVTEVALKKMEAKLYVDGISADEAQFLIDRVRSDAEEISDLRSQLRTACLLATKPKPDRRP